MQKRTMLLFLLIFCSGLVWGQDAIETTEEKPKTEKPVDAPDKYLLYFGALQSWQGVDVLLRSFARLRDLEDLYLVICASNYSRNGMDRRDDCSESRRI